MLNVSTGEPSVTGVIAWCYSGPSNLTKYRINNRRRTLVKTTEFEKLMDIKFLSIIKIEISKKARTASFSNLHASYICYDYHLTTNFFELLVTRVVQWIRRHIIIMLSVLGSAPFGSVFWNHQIQNSGKILRCGMSLSPHEWVKRLNIKSRDENTKSIAKKNLSKDITPQAKNTINVLLVYAIRYLSPMCLCLYMYMCRCGWWAPMAMGLCVICIVHKASF